MDELEPIEEPIEEPDQSLLALPSELLQMVLRAVHDQTTVRSLCTTLAVNHRFRDEVDTVASAVIHCARPDLTHSLNGISLGTRLRTIALLEASLLVAAGGYNSSWNNHRDEPQAADSPGCEQSVELTRVIRPANSPLRPRFLPNMRERRADLALVPSQTRATVFAVGGRSGSNYRRSCEMLDLARAQLVEGSLVPAAVELYAWQPLPSMTTPRCAPIAGEVDGHLFAAGGGHHEGGRTGEMLRVRYEDGALHHETPAVNPDFPWREPTFSSSWAWSRIGPMKYARQYGASAVCRRQLWAIGGSTWAEGLDGLASVEYLDAATGMWHDGPPTAMPRGQASATAHDGRIFVVAGGLFPPGPPGQQEPVTEMVGGRFPFAEWLDPREGVWHPLAFEMDHGSCRGLAGTSLAASDGVLYWSGGVRPPNWQQGAQDWEGPPTTSLDEIWRYDLRAGRLVTRAEGSEDDRLLTPRWCGGSCVVEPW